MCDLNEIENEYHFVLYCPFYWKICEDLLSNSKTQVNLIDTDDLQQLTWLLEKETFKFANYSEKAWDLRKGVLYK